MINDIVKLGYSEADARELVRVSKDIKSDYNLLLNKYPIQYLIGYVNFYGYNINVNSDVLIPRYETEFLVEKTIKLIDKYFKGEVNILDLCTGSGAIGIVLKNKVNSKVFASDISENALKVAKNNAKLNNCDINFIQSDLFSNINDKFDVIISNPPYISYDGEVDESVKKYEPNIALFANDNGLFFYKEIFKSARNYLNDKFIMAFEIGYDEGDSLIKIASEYFNDSVIYVEKDLSNKDRYLFIIKE